MQGKKEKKQINKPLHLFSLYEVYIYVIMICVIKLILIYADPNRVFKEYEMFVEWFIITTLPWASKAKQGFLVLHSIQYTSLALLI